MISRRSHAYVTTHHRVGRLSAILWASTDTVGETRDCVEPVFQSRLLSYSTGVPAWMCPLGGSLGVISSAEYHCQ